MTKRSAAFEYLKKMKNSSEYLNYGREHIRYVCNKYLQNHTTDMVVVDVGAGQGDDLEIAQSIFGTSATYTAVEGYEPYQERLRSRGIEVVSLDIERDRLPFADGSVDIIIVNQVLEHTKDIFWIISEFSRVLKTGGVCIVGVPNLAAFHNRAALLFGMQPTCIEPLSAHVRGFTFPGLTRLFERNSYFTATFRFGANFYPFSPRIVSILEKLLPTFCVGIIAVYSRTAKQGSFLEVLDQDFYETLYYRGK